MKPNAIKHSNTNPNTMMPVDKDNLIRPILEAANRDPERLALHITRLDGQKTAQQTARETAISYGQLLALAARYQAGLQACGLGLGDRVLVLSTVRLELYALIIALLGLGMVPVLIDRGMSAARIRAAIRLSRAKAAVGEVAIVRYWWLFRPLWRLTRLAFDGRAFGVRNWQRDLPGSAALHCQPLPPDAHGLITFTSGSTGLPKGADRTHGSLIAQHRAIRAQWPDQPEDRDSPCFPVLVLHNLSCGISSLLPPIDLGKPGHFDAGIVLDAYRQQRISRIEAAPAFMQHLCQYALQQGIPLPEVRAIAIGGSTLPDRLLPLLPQVFPNASILGVYGSTEAEPIAKISLEELLRDGSQQDGYLIGWPSPDATVVLIPTTQVGTFQEGALPIRTDAEVWAAALPAGVPGELLVSGAHVLAAYLDNPEATRESKIPRPDGTVWHRTGDVAQWDAQGRLWLLGRLKDRIDAIPATDPPRHWWPYVLERQLDALPNIARSVVLATPEGPCVLLVPMAKEAMNEQVLADALRRVLGQAGLERAHWAVIDTLPVDGRHNSKIDRVALLERLHRARGGQAIRTAPLFP